MVLEARQLVDSSACNDSKLPVQALNAFGYEEASQHVYGMTSGDWKKRYQKKATDEQMARYEASQDLHARHDSARLATRADRPPAAQMSASNTTSITGEASISLLSNVCCEDVESVAVKTAPASENYSRIVGPFQPPPIPRFGKAIRMGILTVSDRAYRNEYATGDLSGPAVAEVSKKVVVDGLDLTFEIVPDEVDAIQSKLRLWSDGGTDVIFTTGGTGMSARDVTPEATRAVLDHELPGLMTFVTTECSRQQPLASLSRGTAGIRKNTLVANLPGNPKGVAEVVPILLPLLLNALVDLR